MNLVPLPAFNDNYIWMLHDGAQALVVDPGDPAPVMQALQAQGLQLAAILVTHHHGDHTGGIATLKAATGATVIGTGSEGIAGIDEPVHGGETLSVMGLKVQVLAVPGHTRAHVAFWLPLVGMPQQAPVLFCGDTLFSAGCGRLFEGSPQQMAASLQALAALPEHTRVCCAHEYTLSNLRFALAVEPDNAATQAHAQHCQALRAAGRPTLPSTLALEKQINPFLRCDQPQPRASALARESGLQTSEEVFAALRRWKNEFA
ncbi:hydroxyacylglutathione hydrolase [Curvibacter sp. APW13]|uniref:hydroxyacylglutathione hydrolase n=1 Tax=Curvibacter sp. APW13 TaxID=3077236 RepID=UPI0028E02985|nr:hydroxyacylglutathione hydrolase [Curvibacter sp. APW13]MDT8992226.1 hydroxyacylglutathione hydrolase [Curvibacter sp. APW13]